MIDEIESDRQHETQSSGMKINATITNNECAFTIGGDSWEEVPDGQHIAVCSKVMPDFKWRGIPKLMIYFTITGGQYDGYRARLAYNYNKDTTGPTFGKYSKFVSDVKKIFSDKFNDLTKKEVFDPINLFFGKNFKITTELRKGNAMVQNIDRDDPVCF